MQALEPPQRRKKPVTYGRGRRPQIGFQYAFDHSDASSTNHSPSRLSKITHSPARSSIAGIGNHDDDLFDVPSSDEERTPKRHLPNSRISSARSTQSPSPAIKRNKDTAPRAKNSSTRSKGDFALNPKKRKIADVTRNKIPSSKAEDIDKAIDLQFEHDMLRSSAALPMHIVNQERNSTRDPQEDTQLISKNAKVQEKLHSKLSKPQKRSELKKPGATGQQRLGKGTHERLHRNPSISPPRSLSPLHDYIEPSTPPSRTRDWASPGSEKKAMSTPRQAQLWRSVLGDEMDDPGNMSLGKLNLSHFKDAEAAEVVKSQIPRKRLVDQLKESQPASDGSDDDLETTRLEVTDEPAPPAKYDVKKDDTSVSAASSQNPGTKEGGSRITYASQRSYLQDPDTDIEALLQQPLEVDESPLQISRSSQPTSAANQADVYDVSEGGDEGKPLRSVHELRAAGTSHRFAGDMDAMLVDLAGIEGFSKKSLLSSKRNSWLELSKRCVDADFKSRFLQSGYDHQVFELASKESDPIISAAAAVFAAFLLEDNGPSQTARHIHSLGATETISLSLSQDRDITTISKDRNNNLSKLAQGYLKDIRARLVSSSLWGNLQPEIISPRLISLKALELVVRRLRETGDVEALLNHSVLQQLLDLLGTCLDDVRHAANLNKQYHIILIETGLSLLESSTVVPSCASDPVLWNAERMKRLVSLLDTAFGLQVSNTASVDQLALRICLNIANNNERNSDFFAHPPFITKILSFISTTLTSISNATDQTGESPEVNNLILSLGAMINLAEWSDNVRQVVATACSDILTTLLKTFVKSRKAVAEADSIEASRANVVFGYLAVLLANLCQNEEVRSIAKNTLPKNKTNVIVEAVEEFIGHNERADREQGTEMWVAFTKRLQSVADSLKAIWT